MGDNKAGSKRTNNAGRRRRVRASIIIARGKPLELRELGITDEDCARVLYQDRVTGDAKK
jgi:hypothetical protein